MWRTQGEPEKTADNTQNVRERERKNNRETKKQYANAIVQHTFERRVEGAGKGDAEGECANELAAAANVCDNYACRWGRVGQGRVESMQERKLWHKQLELENQPGRFYSIESSISQK